MKIETAYNLGDTVFALVGHKIEGHVINSIKFTLNYHGDGVRNVQYRLKGEGSDKQSDQWWVKENHIFPTKEALLASL